MKTKQISATVCISVIFMLMSCRKRVDSVIDSLLRAEQCMESHPDSALSILQAIPYPEKLEGKQQADYGLLMTQAIDKNFLMLESDSLVQLAVSYYENSNNKTAKGKASFYYGRYLFLAQKYEEALDEFLKSKQALDGSDQYKMLGLLAEYIGGINLQRHLYDEALQRNKESLRYYDLVEDTLSQTFALRNIGRTYMLRNEVDLAFYYYTSALKIAGDKGLRSKRSILHELGILIRNTGNYEKADYFILSSIDERYAVEEYTKYLSLGILYFEMGRYVEAEKYLKKSLGSHKSENHSSAYSYLYKISLQKGDYEHVVNYIEKRDSVRSLLMNQKNSSYVLELQRKYENVQLKNEILQIRNNRNIILLLGIIFMLITLLIAIYYYQHNLNNKRRIKDIEDTINQNQKEIEDYKRELSDYIESKIDHQNEIGELVGKIALLTNQNRDLTERLLVLGHDKVALEDPESESGLYVVALRTLLAIKNGCLNRKLSDGDINQLIKLFNFLYHGYIDRLIEEFPGLTKHEIELCCLLKLQLTHQELCSAFNATSESVRKAKTRLKTSLGISADDNLEDFLLKY